MKISDYIYYRISLFLKGRIKNWHNASIALISLIQISILTYPLITILKLWHQMELMNKASAFGIILSVIIYLINQFRYSSLAIYERVEKQYKEVDLSSRRIHGIIISILIVIAFFYAPILLILTGAKLGY